MIPEIGSEWIARDGRKMRVEEVIYPVDPSDLPWCKMIVLNARKGMKRRTTMSTGNFSDREYSKFLRPANT